MNVSLRKPSQTNEESFESIFTKYDGYIKRVVLMYMNNSNIVEDLSQEVWIKIFRNIHNFNRESSIKTWMYRITINHCKDFIRSNYNKNVPIDDIVIKDTKHEPENQLLFNFEKEMLSEVICSLPVKYREVVSLYYLHDMKLKEISMKIDLNASSVRVRLYRARQLIKSTILKEFV